MVYAVVLLVFVAFAIAITFRPVSIIALATSLYVFEQWAQANSPFFAARSSLINLAFGVLALYALACVVLRGRNPLTPATGAMWVYLALITFAGLSCLWSLDRGLSTFLFKYHLPYVITFIGIVPLIIQDRDDLRRAFTMSLVFGSITGLMLLVGTQVHAFGRTVEVAHGTAVVDPRTGRSITRLAPLAVGDLGGQLVIIAMMMNFRGVGRVLQYLRWAVVPLGLVLIYRSGSRGQLIATILAVVMFVAFSRGTKQITGWIAAGVSTLLIIGASVWAFVGFAGNADRWDINAMQTQFSSTRLYFSFKLLDYWVDSSPVNWLFGLGSSASYDNRIIGAYCHITVVEVLCELGFFGFGLLCAWGFFVGRDILRLYSMTQNSDVDRGVAVAISALFVYAVILSFKQGSFLTNTFLFASGLMICRHTAVMQSALRREHARDLQQRWQAYYARLRNAYQQTSPQT